MSRLVKLVANVLNDELPEAEAEAPLARGANATSATVDANPSFRSGPLPIPTD